ncbi:hypothetical protein BP6252_08858 [Coleophoma cylindrospora]|uniref:MT-A70-domain-containing protein n=1 Tax=Coleophoma cylindrospora TaxID=1849047 RepID=A0A3D8R7C8_9HELO|nr:hypothetical protein BP6252_08858 [Coleophoma cylindrospora]
MESCILYQNAEKTVTLIDIPASIELAQGNPVPKRLVSSQPRLQPYPSVEPRTAKARSNRSEISLRDLLLHKHLQLALDEIKASHQGSWCSPRVTNERRDSEHVKKRRRRDVGDVNCSTDTKSEEGELFLELGEAPFLSRNGESTPASASAGSDKTIVTLPPKSTILCGEVEATIELFEHSSSKFDLIVLDPPWPNRSARRKQSYDISYGPTEIRFLLSSLPIYDHLAEEALVAVWVTNKSAFHEMLLEEGGLFQAWGIKWIEEWIWLKVTTTGEPICEIDSAWRKPYEILLIGRKTNKPVSDVTRKVVVGVPDLHSRKPNLKALCAELLPSQYEALEIFARNLTSGWWSWGNEVLKFQTEEHWASP